MTAVCFSTEDKPSSSYGKPPCDRVTHIPRRSVTIYSLVRNRKQTRPGYIRRHGTKYLAWNPFSLTRAATLPSLAYSYFPILSLTSYGNFVHRKFCSDNRMITAGINERFGLLDKSEAAGGEYLGKQNAGSLKPRHQQYTWDFTVFNPTNCTCNHK